MAQNRLPNGSRLFNSSYIIDDFISAAGKTGVLYLVHREGENNIKFAAKVVYRQKEWTDAFWNKLSDEEVTNFRIMNQENLVQTFDAFSVNTEGTQVKVLIMEYVDGISLSQYIRQHGCIVPKVALNIFSKILAGIKVLHNYKHTIIHRDLKPDNIIVSRDLSKITILDFGVATVFQKIQNSLQEKQIQCFTDETEGHGTYPYVIPDAGRRKANQPTNATVQFDFYSLGVILYEMLMGERPFDFDKLPPGTSDIKKMNLPLRFDIYNISSNPTITPTIENLIFRCLACKPADLLFRYQNIEQLIEDCDKAIASLSLKEDTTPLLKPVNKRTYPRFHKYDPDVVKSNQAWYKRWSVFFVFAALAAAILITALVLFFK